MNRIRLFSLLLVAVGSPIVSTADETVTNTNDAGAGSLRQALNDVDPGDTIVISASLSGQTLTLETTLMINKSLTIDGSALSVPLTISGDKSGDNLAGPGDVRVFEISGIPDVLIDTLIIAFGKAADGAIVGQSGGGILMTGGSLTLRRVEVSGCKAGNGTDSTGIADGGDGGSGGGLFSNSGTVLIDRSTFAGNTAGNGGDGDGNTRDAGNGGDGGGYAGNSDLTIVNSTFFGNNAGTGGLLNYLLEGKGGNGGAISSTGQATTEIRSSTITQNRAGDAAFGNNSAPAGSGGGLYIDQSAALNMSFTIVAENLVGFGGDGTESGDDIRSTAGVNRTGVNLVGNNDSVETAFPAAVGPGPENTNLDLIGTDSNPLVPSLKQLADNGGPTLTRLPNLDSIVVDPEGSATSPTEPTDQTGQLRLSGDSQDIGAVELQTQSDPQALAELTALSNLILKAEKLRKKIRKARKKKRTTKVKRLTKRLKRIQRMIRGF